MYKVLIVDDELLVRVGLKTSIDWESNGFTVIGEAKNGREAVEIFDLENPDILITDVSMPGMSGLELIEVLKKKKKDLVSIILTHYDDFNYAQEAISLGVTGYLLKSNLTQENLLLHLNKAADKVGPVSNVIEKKDNSYDLKYLLEAEEKDETRLQEIKEKYFPFKRFIISNVLFHSQKTDSTVLESSIAKYEKNITDLSEQIFSDYKMTVLHLIMEKKTVYFINIPDEAVEHEFQIKLDKIMEILKKNIEKYLNINIAIGISSVTDNISDLHNLYNEALTARQYSFFEKINISKYNKSIMNNPSDDKSFDISELNKLVSSGNSIEMNEYLSRLFNYISEYKNIDYLTSCTEKLISNVKSFFTKKEKDIPTVINNINSKDDIFTSFLNMTSYTLYFTDLYHDLLLTLSTGNKKESNSYIVQKSMEYIKKHSSENISLSSVAKHVEVSRTYLSFLFKQELDVNFSTYITGIRIDKAKEMLLSSNMKIYEIAYQVGFESPYYFSKVFKENTGMTCKVFRNKYYREGDSSADIK